MAHSAPNVARWWTWENGLVRKTRFLNRCAPIIWKNLRSCRRENTWTSRMKRIKHCHWLTSNLCANFIPINEQNNLSSGGALSLYRSLEFRFSPNAKYELDE